MYRFVKSIRRFCPLAAGTLHDSIMTTLEWPSSASSAYVAACAAAILTLHGYCTATAQPWADYTIVNSMMLGYPRASDRTEPHFISRMDNRKQVMTLDDWSYPMYLHMATADLSPFAIVRLDRPPAGVAPHWC